MIWTAIKHAINSTLGTAGFKPLNTLINEGVRTVKSVQRGAAVFSGDTPPVIVLSAVNPAKCTVSLHGTVGYLGGTVVIPCFPYVYSLSGNSLSVRTSSQFSQVGGGWRTTDAFSWEVVEYY